MTAVTPLTPLKCAGYALPTPPRCGTWQIDPARSVLELRLRDLHRRSVLLAPIRHGDVSLTERAGTSAIRLRLGIAGIRHGTRRAARWLEAVGLDSLDQPSEFGSELFLAAPDGWRMSGRLSSANLDAMLVADVRIHSVSTQPNGQDAMVLTAAGTISRGHAPGLSNHTLGKRVTVRIAARMLHD
ncbi:MAG: hypothetical protein QOI26_1791 [Pseudonocardiales bacterium]|jgi:hypothetical protein|nr:hypothetical protein [Pseudonocardiales bacterium]